MFKITNTVQQQKTFILWNTHSDQNERTVSTVAEKQLTNGRFYGYSLDKCVRSVEVLALTDLQNITRFSQSSGFNLFHSSSGLWKSSVVTGGCFLAITLSPVILQSSRSGRLIIILFSASREFVLLPLQCDEMRGSAYKLQANCELLTGKKPHVPEEGSDEH